MGENEKPTNFPMPVEDRRYGRIGAGLPEYIHNDTFDENIEKHIFWGMNRNYYRALEAQQKSCNIRQYTMPMSIFKIDNELNNKYGFISNHQNSSDNANGTHFKTYSAKIAWNLIDHSLVKDVKHFNIALDSDSESQKGWKCRNPYTIDTPDTDHSYMTYSDSSGKVHTDPWHNPDYKATGGRDVCNSPKGLFSKKSGLDYDIKKRKYLRTFTTEDMCAHSSLFLYRTLFFIRGFLHTNIKYGVDENHLYIFICVDDGTVGTDDMIPEWQIQDYIQTEVPFTLLMMPWGTTMEYNGIGNDENFVDGNGLNYKAFENLTPTMALKKNFWMISTSWKGNNKWPKHMMVSTFASINPIRIGSSTKDVFNIASASPAILESLINNDSKIHAEAFCIPNVEGYSYIGTNRVFQIPINGNPIPPNNILLWKYTPADTTDESRKMDAGTYEFIHYSDIILYYPNVYQIVDVPDDTEILVMWFYNHNYETTDNHFTNVLSEYMKYNSNFAAACVNGDLPSYISSYIPAKISYDYTDYERYNKSTMTDAQTYKIDKLTELMKDDPTRYEHVYEKLMECTSTKLHANPKQTINLNRLSDSEYDNAFRNDMSDFNIVDDNVKAETRFESITFDEPHLMLTIEHPFITSYEYAIWIDGLECDSVKVYTKFLRTFIYIPESKLTRNSVIEVEMMRIPEHGRIVEEITFSDADTSIKLPRAFYDVSPQNMLVSVRVNTSTWKEDTEMSKEYARQLDDPDIYEVSNDIGVKFIYQAASDYEMSWLLFGYNRYVDGRRQTFDDNWNVIKNNQRHEIKYTHPYFVEPDASRKHYYGYVTFTGVDGNIKAEFKEKASGNNQTYIAPFEKDSIYVATNLGNKKFIATSDLSSLTVFNTSLATFKEIDYFRKSYYHHHNNANDTFVSAIRIIGMPLLMSDGREGFLVDVENPTPIAIEPDDIDDTALYVVIGDDSYTEYRYDKLSSKFEMIYTSQSDTDDEELSSLTTTLLNASPDGKRWMELYTAFDESVADAPTEKAITNPTNLESGLSTIRTKDNEMIVTAIDYPWCDGFYALDRRRFYQYLPYGVNAEKDIYLTPIGIPSTKASVDVVTKFKRDTSISETMNDLTYHPLIETTSDDVERIQYYTSTEYPESYFSHKTAIIQNTDIYNKENFILNYIETNQVAIGHFYDEPIYQRFRVTVNGYRMDHGTDFTTDINAIRRFIRGDRIVFTFDKQSANFINAVQREFRLAPRIYGMIVIEPNEDGSVASAGFQITNNDIEEVLNLSTSSVYVDTQTQQEYVYNPKSDLLIPYDTQKLVDTGFTTANVVIEYMPYKSRIVYKSNSIKSNCINMTDQQLDRPISLKYYDLYLGGVKLNQTNVKIVSPRKIIVESSLIYDGACLTVYERCHDKDLYGNEISMPNSMNDIIAQHDPDFRKFLYSNA